MFNTTLMFTLSALSLWALSLILSQPTLSNKKACKAQSLLTHSGIFIGAICGLLGWFSLMQATYIEWELYQYISVAIVYVIAMQWMMDKIVKCHTAILGSQPRIATDSQN